ncbi:MAG: tRNA (N(6)-L-threonylcarbamoyladenosine(37)-C(2))-methylthiotransferase [Candidatus Altiarchaeota archaeon]
MTRVSILTYGCSMNKADSEIISGMLKRQGIRIVNDSEIVIVNTCTVKTPTERKILKKLRELEKSKKKVIVVGCLPIAQPEISEKFKKFSFIGSNFSDIPVAINYAIKGKKFVEISNEREIEFETKLRSNKFVEITPIAQGCLGSCSYCITKISRGKLKSIPEEKILKHIENALKENVKEIWLTAQDTGAYGFDIGTNLPNLVREITKLNGKFFIRIGMMNPKNAKKILDELIEIYKSEKVYKFFHLPVQSGDDEILEKMQRNYTVEDFKKILYKLREEIPEITISTDIIVGFPTESEEQFQNTLKLIEEIKPDVLNISRFWPRPKTMAAKMTQLPGRETKRRSRIATELFKKIGLERNKRWISWQGEALISEYDKKTNTYTARNFAYKPIILKSRENLLGEFVRVKVKEATCYDLRAEVLRATTNANK